MPSEVHDVLRGFFDVQSSRAKLYVRFQDGFKAFTHTKQEALYRSLMAEVAASFTDCSRRVMALEATLKELGRADLGATLREVQEWEREKLRLTLALQALKQAAAFRTFSWQQQQQQQGGADEDDEALALLDPQLAAASARGHGHGHAHGHAHAHAHSHAAELEGGTSSASGGGGTEAAAGPGPGSVPGTATSDGLHAEGTCAAAAEAANGHYSTGNGGEAASEGVEGDVGAQAEEGVGGDGGSNSGAAAAAAHANGGGAEHAGGGGGHGHGHSGGCGCGGGSGPPEPTRREYEAAVKEAVQALDGCVCKINEAMCDLRVELDDEE
ncbi:hypothetical protein TSOC_000870 [Tetrabaena socialis]|uniref:Uncharacterized protein n=1 Tax=Tetrabaena socialis TaxID=47790 RepID=A0A2J8AI87_9CHLO|nr:hypothetical protein TSOC_000870 [Tetrabaena socialis]|eukprot:PNH12239.1 hypothetical protein TSOC_000870 [Tetrabaena socialis]